MAKEIEHKYLVRGDAWRALPVNCIKDITQAYLKPATPMFIEFHGGAVAFSFRSKNGDIHFTVPRGPATEDFAAVATFPNYDSGTGRLNLGGGMTFRIRTADDGAAFVTIKRPTDNAAVKDEYELPIPFDAARRIQDSLCEYFVTKKRHMIDFQNVMWEVDVFSGVLEGLVIAEVEAADLEAFKSIAMLPGVIEDVTGWKGVSNYALGRYGIPAALVKKPEAGGPPFLGPS